MITAAEILVDVPTLIEAEPEDIEPLTKAHSQA
jgi:hypothetical protein